jgi:1-deoxy-D-xylulose-5-phosphate reductoisomerase
MKKKIAVIGSTGSIGKSLLRLIDKKNIEIVLLVANKNYTSLINQATFFNVKNVIITDYNSYKLAIKFNKNNKIKIYNNFDNIKNIINKKIDYVMSSVSGISGLLPTFTMIKFTKKIAIANKESLICAWPLIKKELVKHKTIFIPVDSEHFSVWTEIENVNPNNINKIYLTASGGPLLNRKIKSLKNVNYKDILKHPTWNMGKKISVDSATMMNKFFEVMEAKNIFNLDYEKINILIHPDSYVHAIIEYKNGISKIILHDTTMAIPIFNTIYSNNEVYPNHKRIDIKKLNSLNFQKVSIKKYPVISYLKNLPKKHSLFETVIVAINDVLVGEYLNKKIRFEDISKLFLKNVNLKCYKKYKKIRANKIDDIIILNNIINLNITKSLI